VPPQRRLPSCTIAFGLRVNGRSPIKIVQEVKSYATMLNLVPEGSDSLSSPIAGETKPTA